MADERMGTYIACNIIPAACRHASREVGAHVSSMPSSHAPLSIRRCEGGSHMTLGVQLTCALHLHAALIEFMKGSCLRCDQLLLRISDELR
jgi:hypothetical protein